MIKFVGNKFGVGEPWSKQEHYIIDSVQKQIQNKFNNDRNILINLTWLGPQFNNGVWESLLELNESYDNVFWLASVDPISLDKKQRQNIVKNLNASKVFEIGTSFNPGRYTFNTGAIASYEDFPVYKEDDLELKNVSYKYMCLNRKPKPHRINLVQKLIDNDLKKCGLITLGKDNVDYN